MEDPNKVKEVFRILGNQGELTEHENWISGSCPFATWTHEEGTDNRPSFGISLREMSVYNCFACNKKGLLQRLPTALFEYSGEYNRELREYVFKNEFLGLSSSMEKQYERRECEEARERITEEEYNRVYSEFKGNYRSISETTIRTENIRYHQESGRLVIPIRTRGGTIVGLKARALFDSSLKYVLITDGGFKDPKTYGVWFGEHWEANQEGKLIIVEGELDAILLKQERPKANIIACMGVGITKNQILRLHKMLPLYPKGVVLFLDDDLAGRNLTRILNEKLKNLTVVYRINDYHGCKDPADAVIKNKLAEIERSGITSCN